jgi:glycosyltransferase involved in cell wall biosynthesis
MAFLLLMPSYNQAHFIADAIRSVLAQDDPDWELWIVDNSTDDTPEVVRGFADPRIHFHHLEGRMDPGSCLNWMLERVDGRDFSYIHTDNNLRPSYVRRLRAALQGHALSLAYCDMRTIDARGVYLNVHHRRGRFDLPRLMSIDTLGVPFAATTELAKKVGGFTVRDVADDVVFCIGAYGLAQYVYVPEELIDYRMHKDSRTEEVGGSIQMERVLAHLMSKLAPVLEQRGVHPKPMLRQAIDAALNELDRFVEDLWRRKIARWSPTWNGALRFDDFFFSGIGRVPGFTASFGRPKRRHASREIGRRFGFFGSIIARCWLALQRRDIQRLLKRSRSMLLSWAMIELQPAADEQVAFRLGSLDFRTLWAGRQLQVALGWEPLLDSHLQGTLPWLQWRTASGNEPVLDCSAGIRFERKAGER